MARELAKARRSLATAEARRALPGLVKEMGAKGRPSSDLLADAVEIGPHRRGGAVLIPEVDAVEHARQVEALRSRVAELEDGLEDAGMAMFLQERLASTSGERLSAEQFLRGIGMDEFVAQLPGG